MTTIGILAGAGRLPLMIAESASQRGTAVHIVGIEGEADPAIARFPHTWVNWGQIGRMVRALAQEGGRQMVIAGAARRPDLKRIRPDAGFFRNLPFIVRLLAGGDDAVLKRVVRFFEAHGFEVLGVHEVSPDLLAGCGRMGAVTLSAANRADAEIGFAVRRALGAVDAGQAVAVAGGKVLAIEGAEGTDAMLQRVAALAFHGGGGLSGGVLTKGPKPGQELRVDMPAIGPYTIEQAAAAGLAGVAVASGAVLILDRADAIRIADAHGCALEGLTDPEPAGGQAAAPRLMGRVIGRRRPNRRDAADIATGVIAVAGLAPFATGRGVVVVRRYVRAIEAAEGPTAMLERAAALRRQWGLRWRKAGAFVRRAEAGEDGKGLAALLSRVAAQELAGIALTGSAQALSAYEDAGRLADDLGLFLVLCEAGAGASARENR
ncbi:MAG TPA: UDP-2,3-diacylglucosamine diphosphatase LpxI [Hyphomicrobiaceae bacterium]|nr:UDP-2,3-diacylglucosamine diphosphatase LpxI [Hyphomicrobiaceae bacterium]